jgi:hypothetical protein
LNVNCVGSIPWWITAAGLSSGNRDHCEREIAITLDSGSNVQSRASSSYGVTCIVVTRGHFDTFASGIPQR